MVNAKAFLVRTFLIVVLVLGLQGVSPAFAACGTARIIYVSPAGNGTDGCSWGTAFPTLQSALAIASSSDQIWVAAGTYYPDEGVGQTNNDRNSTFQLINGVSIYGGFNGTETQLSQRNTSANITVLNGDIGTLGVSSDNAYHIVSASGILSTTRLDGFTIRNGNANGPSNFGGGVYIISTNTNLTLANLTVTNNSAGNGGGLYANDSDLAMNNVTFSNNTGTVHGGGAYIDVSDMSLTNVTFSGNRALALYGGGMYTSIGNPSLTNVVFDGNISAEYGGGIYNVNGSPILLNVVFNANQTQEPASPGAGMHNSNLDTEQYTMIPTLTNVTFSNNQALQGGGAGLFNFQTHAVLTNVTFSGNSAYVRGGAILNEGSNPILNNVTFNNNTAPAGTGGAMRNIYAYGTIPSNPIIRNSILWDNGTEEIVNDAGSGATVTDSVLEGACPALTTCTNTINANPNLGPLANNGGSTQTRALGVGSSALNTGGVNVACASTDQRGVLRPQGVACDIGAFEAETGGAPTPTFAPTSTNTPLPTNTPVPTSTNTPVPGNTATNTPVPSNTPAPTNTFTPTATSSSGTIRIGETNVLSTNYSGNGNRLVVQQVTLSQSATIQSLSYYVATAGGQLRMGIYNNAGSAPGTLVAETATFTPVVGWNTQPVLTQTVLPAGTYWLAFLPQSSTLAGRVIGSGTGRYYSYTFGALPGTFSSTSTSSAFRFSFYATLTTGSAPATNTPVPTNTFTSTPANTPTFTPAATNTPIPATATNTPVFTPTKTNTPLPTNTATFTPVPTNTATSTATPSGGTITLGETTVLSTNYSGNGNRLVAQRVTLSQSATIQSLSYYVSTAGGQLRLGIYNNSATNTPGTLVAETAAFTPVVGWNTQPVLTQTTLPAGTYWLAFLPQSNALAGRVVASGVGRHYSYTFGALPGTFSSTSTSATFRFSFYATLSVP